MLNTDQVRKNCGDMGTQGNFGKKKGTRTSPRDRETLNIHLPITLTALGESEWFLINYSTLLFSVFLDRFQT